MWAAGDPAHTSPPFPVWSPALGLFWTNQPEIPLPGRRECAIKGGKDHHDMKDVRDKLAVINRRRYGHGARAGTTTQRGRAAMWPMCDVLSENMVETKRLCAPAPRQRARDHAPVATYPKEAEMIAFRDAVMAA